MLAAFRTEQPVRFDHIVSRVAGQRHFVDLQYMHLPADWTLRQALPNCAPPSSAASCRPFRGCAPPSNLLPTDVEAHFDDPKDRWIAVLQRVAMARVEVAGRTVGEIGPGLLILVCAEALDTPALADKMVAKWLQLRVFSDEAGKMNRSVQDIARRPAHRQPVHPGGRHRTAPSFTGAAPAEQGRRL